MKTALQIRRLAFAAAAAFTLFWAAQAVERNSSGAASLAHAQSVPSNSAELEQILFVQVFSLKEGKDGITVSWIPQPIQKYCVGKTSQQCATMDFCLRTTSPDVAMCRNLGSAFTHMPRYPSDMRPKRMLSISLIPPSTMKGFGILQQLVQNAPRPSLQHLSMTARIKARIRFTRRPDDDDFDLLEILAAPPF
jgi:hypothetical protein